MVVTRKRGKEGGREEERERGRKKGAHLFINVRDVCLCILHLNEPLLPILVGHSITVSEGPGGTHVQGNLQ